MEASYKCLADNNYDNRKCRDYFKAYQECKKQWLEEKKKQNKIDLLGWIQLLGPTYVPYRTIVGFSLASPFVLQRTCDDLKSKLIIHGLHRRGDVHEM